MSTREERRAEPSLLVCLARARALVIIHIDELISARDAADSQIEICL